MTPAASVPQDDAAEPLGRYSSKIGVRLGRGADFHGVRCGVLPRRGILFFLQDVVWGSYVYPGYVLRLSSQGHVLMVRVINERIADAP